MRTRKRREQPTVPVRLCENCVATKGLEEVQVVALKGDERSRILLCSKCLRSEWASWRLRWRPISEAA